MNGRVLHWNPIVGCAIASPGCSMCAAMRLAGEMTADGGSGPVWTGAVRFEEDALATPLRVKEPTTVAVCSRSDLFYEAVPDEWVDRILSVIEAAPQHVYQILTKRPARARQFVAGRALPATAVLGVSVEREQEGRQRIPELLATPAPARFVMFYPLLGAINLAAVLVDAGYQRGEIAFAGIGGEPDRPFRSEWFREVLMALSMHGIAAARVYPETAVPRAMEPVAANA